MTPKNASGLHKATALPEDPLSMLLEESVTTGTTMESATQEEPAEFFAAEAAALPEAPPRAAYEGEGRRRSAGPRAATQLATGGPMLPLGWGLVLAGAALGALAATGAVPALSELVGKGLLAGSALIAAGTVLIAARAVLCHQTTTTQWLFAQQTAALETVQADVDELLGHHRAIAERPPKDDTEALDRATLAIQRQDEKLANLSKALKMYGKPLMDISQQTSDIGQLLSDLGQSVQASKAFGEQATRSVETIVRGQLDGLEARQAPAQQKLEDVATATRSQQQALITLQKDSREGIQRHVALERLLDELKKQLATVTGHFDKVAATPTQPRDESKVLAQIEQQVGGARDAMLAQVKREMATIQTQLARIQVAAASSASVPAAGPAEATAKANSLSGRDATEKEAQPLPAVASTATSSVLANEGTGPGGLAQSIAGEKKTESRNVLGAIAKLKNMRK